MMKGANRLAVAAFLLIVTLTSNVLCQDVVEEPNNIEVTRIKRDSPGENRDLTVLLVNDQQRDINSRLGRFQNVKPVIGLLTSTARTFIQDGVTTEFATQILGTTLDNGRIYAQLLTKSSLVLYNKPSRVDDTSFIRPTSLPNEGKWSVKQDLGFIDPNKFVLKNTDYLKPQNDKMYTVYASKPSYLDRTKVWGDHKVENDILSNDLTARKVPFNAHQAFSDNNSNNLENSYFDNERILEQPTFLENVNSLHRHRPIETVIDFVSLDAKQDETPEVIISKVKPDSYLPTYTVKNEFSPIFYYIDNVESKPTPSEKSTTKLPKKMFGGSGDNALKKTFTYAGFADFTTEVGDTVIVFTPNTIKENKPGGIEILQPSVRTPQRLGTKITHLSRDIPIPTKVYTSPRPAFTRRPGLQDLRNDKALHNGEKELKDVLYEDDGLPDSDKVQNNMNFGFNMDAIQPSESLAIIPQNTEITDDLEVIPIATNRYEPTPILKTIKSSPTIKFDKKSSTKAKHVYTTTEEPTSEESTEEDSDFNDDTTEDTLATTFDETDESTEVDDEDTICTNGIMPVKTMTTQYKTLTYLTTYFIPLDDEGTTTSIKSDVVIESTLGFLTNYECKSDYFSPSSVVKYPNKATLLSSEEAENTSSEEFDFDTTTLSSKKNDLKSEEEDSSNNSNETDESEQKSTTKSDARTENIQTTTEKLVQKPTTPEEKPTTEKTTTENLTTEKATTTTERVEFSVTTDESIKVTPEEKEVKEPTEDSENEIDLIYKTLYTTYTYFTTFFHGKSSTVASHKSVVTNVITSTLDLSKLDPSLLDAFEKAPIIPTRVEGQKPTESLNSVIDLFKNKNVLESVENELNYNSQTPTPILNDEHLKTINPDAVKTYYTTYTFFTTIYVGSDANICSRSEVHTNYIGPDTLLPTKSNPLTLESTKKEFDFRNCRKVTAGSEELPPAESGRSLQDNNKPIAEPSKVVYDMLLSVEAKPINTAADSHVTDVKSSTSKGKQKIIEDNNLFEDQVSSESNIEEIIPSPTLLLQTSYTTFTYFTTLYMGKDSSKIKSHLETITNVVTETIPPQKEPETEEPITYYTTFTYWTTLYKDKITTITSREEVISNVVDPTALPTKEKPKEAQNPIDTTPIEVSSVHQKELEEEIKPTQKYELITDEEKATFYTTYTYFTTFYVGNTSQIRSSLETITNIVDNTRSPSDDNQLGRSVGVIDNKNIIDRNEKPAVIKEKIEVTKVPVLSVIPTVLSGSNIDNILTEVSSPKSTTDGDHKKIIFSQVAVISGDSTIISDGKELKNASTSTAKTTVLSPKPEVVESSITEPTTSTETHTEDENDEETDDGKKKSRLTFTTRKPSFVPVIRPFSSRGRPSFSPKKVPLPIGATTITRSDITPTITATPILKTSKSSGFGSRKAVISPSASPAPGRRFTGRSSTSLTSASPTSSTRTFGRGRPSDVQPTSRRSGYRSSTSRNANLETTATTTTRPASRIRPTIGSRLRGSRIPANVVNQPVDTNIPAEDVPEEQTTDNISEQTQITSEPTVQRTTNPLLRFRRPLSRSPGSAVTSQRPTTPTTPSTTKKPAANKGKLATTTTQKSSQKPSNQVNILKSRLRPNALFPRRNLFKQPEPEPEEENVNEQPEEEIEENAEGEAEEQDNDYESSDKLEQPVTSTTTIAPRRSNQVQIKPFAFKRRSKRQADYGARKINIARRPALRSLTIDRRSDPEPDTEPPVAPRRTTSRFTARPAYVQSSTPRQQITSRTSGRPYIIRGETRATAASSTTSLPAFKTRTSRPPPRGTTARARLSSYGKTSTQKTRTKTGRARTRGSTRTSSRFRGNDYNVDSNSYMPIDDGKITITHHIPTEVTIPVVSGRITEYKNVLTAKPSQEVLLPNQYSTSVNALGNPQLVLLTQSTEVLDNGATKLIKFVLNETPTKTVIFTPTTIRGRKTSYSHIVPSTVYNVEYVTQTIQPDINPNVPLANILLSQLLLGNAQQPGINNLLPLQGPGFLPQMPVAQTPVTELRTKPTTYVTTITDVREKVLPITFRGKEILTTIKDPTVKVITATEFITETIVTTPTMYAPQMNQNQLNQNQLNSLLLPLLLQQQQQQQQAMSMQTQNPVSGLGLADLNLLQNNKLQFSNDLFNSPKPDVLEIDNNEDYGQYDDKNSDEDVIEIKTPKLVRPRPVKPLPHKVTSVVTLYVSAFNTRGIVYDNSPWRPGRRLELNESEDERKLKQNLATKILSNGVEVVVKERNDTNRAVSSKSLEDKHLQTRLGDVTSLAPSHEEHLNNKLHSRFEERIDSSEDDMSYEFIQPSEASQSSICLASPCLCTHLRTDSLEHLNTKLPLIDKDIQYSNPDATDRNSDKSTYYNYESAPSDKIVEKYTEVINDYSNEKEELLTNEKAPEIKHVEKNKIKPSKPSKNKFEVTDLLKLGSLGIKSLSQLAPVFEKMTGGLIKRSETNKNSSTVKPVVKLTSYSVNKRLDSEIDKTEIKQGNFPIYIPVDELETSESHNVYVNTSFHRNLPWGADQKFHGQSSLKQVHESPLVNGGIPISPGEVIRANSDLIVGKPAVGGPLTLSASGIKIQTFPRPDTMDLNQDAYDVADESQRPSIPLSKNDDSFDLRPPQPPNKKLKNAFIDKRPPQTQRPKYFEHQEPYNNYNLYPESNKDVIVHSGNFMGPLHGRPAFLDYTPSLAKKKPIRYDEDDEDLSDSSASSSELIKTTLKGRDELKHLNNKPFLVDIQPSKVANILIPKGSSTALIFSGPSEPHKSGQYIDDPLPYQGPGYFGSFNIDAPKTTSVHNVQKGSAHQQEGPHKNPDTYLRPDFLPFKESNNPNKFYRPKYKGNVKRPLDFPPPTSNQETHFQIGPHIAAYNPDIYRPSGNNFEKYNSKNNKHSKIIDKEYENHLAVPPLPPQVKYADNNKPKPFNQRPTIHTKPIHDMKILLNVQHPIPNNYNTENSLPHQITSEIYYAAQGANKLNNPATYSFGFEHSTSQPLSGIPQHSSNQRTNSSFDSKQNSFNDEQKYNQQEVNSNNNANINDFYSVTLNAATNVGENPLTHHNVIGTSIPVPIDGSKHGSNLESTAIPVGANFAIKIEDKPTSYQQFEHNHQHQIDIDHSSHRPDVVVGLHDWDDNFRVSPQFQTTGITSKPEVTTYKTTLSTHSEEQQPHHVVNVQIINAAETPSQNSHANFPMIFNPTTNKYNKDAIKPVTEDVNEADFSDYINRPPKTIHNVPINSHGLYSSNPSLPIDFDINKINKIKIQNVSHNVIPLTSTNENNHPPNFGQKIQNVDIPPFKWSLNRGQKIATSTQKNNNLVSSVSTKLFSHFTTPKYTNTQQHVYNIPAKQETLPTSTKKPDFIENSEEIYDGKDTTEPNYDSEVSLESMTVPKVSSIEEIYPKHNSSTSLLLNEFIETKDHRLNLQDNENSGTQTEKPFKMSQLHSLFSSNEILKPYKGVSMKPSPFKVSAQDNYSHNIKNKTKTKTSVLGLDLNIGEELGQPFTASTPTTRVATTEFYKITTAKPRHKRPIFSLKNNRTTHRNQSEFVSNIITNTVNLSDRKPLTVVNISNERPLSEIYDTISTSSNTSVTEIIDLLPPPVTLPNIISSAEEVIEGMSPPPQRSPITQRNPPTRLLPSPRPFPSRSPPPFRTKPPRTTRPSRPTIKTIPKDGERDEASTLRPTFDILKRRPSYSRNPSYSIPSSAVVETSTRFVRPPNVMNTNSPTTPTFVFPIPNSSGWVTPVSISFPSSDLPEIQPSPVVITETTSTAIFGNDRSTTTEKIEDEIMVIPLDKFYKKTNTSREHSSNSTTEENEIYNGQTEKDLHKKEDQDAKEAEPEGSFDYRPRPDLIRPTKVTTQLKNTKPINTALYPPRKEYKPVIRNNKPTIQPEQTLIESSETYIDNDVIKPTETLKVKSPTVNLQKSSTIYPIVESKATILSANTASIDQKDKDDNLIVLPIKTEYKTKAVTLTKTLSEPPETVSTTRFVTLTHTTTVTRTETSLISQSAGATTQTLIITNTETSTLLDIVTEIQTQVLPTTIVETVTKHIPIIKPTTVTKTEVKTQHPLDDVALSSEEVNYVLPKNESIYNIHKDDNDDTLLIIMNKSQNGGHSPTIKTHNEAEYDGAIRNEDVGGDGVSQVLLGEILLAGTPYLESTHIDTPTVIAYSKECQPDCKASRNERCQRVGGLMKCVCRPGFARMFPDRPCKPTYTYSLRLALGRKGDEKLVYRDTLAMNTSADYQELSEATHEGINRMIMQSDLRDVFHGVQINGFEPITIPKENEKDEYDGVVNDFYVQLSDNAHESRLKEVIEKYLRTNNYSLGGTDVFAARELVDRLEVSDFNECLSPLFHDCSEHAECFNLRGTYTCSCKEGFSDLSVSALYPGRICSAEPIGCETCNFHGSCYNRDDDRVLCECFQWYAGPKCQINLKVVLISLGTLGAVLVAILVACVVTACSRRGRNDDQNSQRPPRSIVATCIQSMPVLPQGAMPSKHHMAHDRRALINERTDSGGDSSSVQNVSLPYMPTKKVSHASNKGCKKISIAGERCDSQSASDSRQPCVMIPRAKLFQSSQRRESREVKESVCRKPSMELSTEEKLISYLESGGKNTDDLMRRKPSAESSYSVSKERHHHKPTGALISAGFKVSTTIKPELDQRMDTMIKEDDMSSINKTEYDRRYNTMGNYSQDDIGDWTDAERRIGELTLSEARSVGGTLPTSTGRAASSARLTQQDAHTMAERDLGSTFLLPHVHLYKPEMISNASDVSEFDSL